MSTGNIKILGEGTVSAGQYADIKIMGIADFLDGVEAKNIRILGEAVLGEVKVFDIVVAGTARFKGSVQVDYIKVNGEADFNQTVKAQTFVVNGSVRAVQGIESEKFIARGNFETDYLNANDVEIYLAGRSRVREIGGESVRVHTKVWYMFFHNLFGKHFQELEVDTIEADRIYLEKTVAQSVKGNDVTIGPGCRIKLVEFKDSISIDKASQVEKTVQI
jgi:cytoskeletal protein CcmA (bactofilin family)